MAVHLNKFLIQTIIKRSCSSAISENKSTCAGIIVIGDEILKGDVRDTNSHYIALELHKLGLNLKKISVIKDDVDAVSEEVRLFSKCYDYVITSGGIGPTHDDVTFEGIAKAFDVPIVINPELRQLCTQFYKSTDPKHPGMKLAQIPKNSKLNYAPVKEGERLNYPVISVKNVYIFPGIPELLKKSFGKLSAQLFKSNKKYFMLEIFCNTTEDKIAESLTTISRDLPNVNFGSYPKLFDSNYTVRITIESQEENETRRAYEKLLNMIPKKYIVKK